MIDCMSAKHSRFEEGFGRSDSSQSLSPKTGGTDFAMLTREHFTQRRKAPDATKKSSTQTLTKEKQSGESPVDLNDFWGDSLKVDICLGWKPQLGIKNPFPLVYPDPLSRSVRCQKDFVYLGARPTHSYDLHMCFSSAQTYSIKQDDLRNFREAVRKQLLVFHPAKPQHLPDPLTFDSFFESGNCDAVWRSRASLHTYDIFLKPDTGTRGHAQWFYFSVYASEPMKAVFQIKNMCKSSSIFAKGGKPFFSRDNTHWDVLEAPAEYFETVFAPDEGWMPPRCRALNTLKFSFNFEQGERVYFSYCPPYTFGMLQRFLDRAQTGKAGRMSFHQEKLCLSLTGLPVQLLRFSQPIIGRSDKREKPIVFVLARAHPGESCGSHMMHGFMEALVSDSEAASSLREVFDFYLLPMVNPDGVVVGNFRTDLVGDDLNRQYVKPSARFHPTIHHLIYLANQLRSHRKIAFCLDFHGHSTRPGVFTYGPQLSASDPLAGFAKVLPWLVSKKTDMFLFDKCTYKVPKQKMKTARAFFLFKKGSPEVSRGQVHLHSRSQHWGSTRPRPARSVHRLKV